jgi:hypothetical protein
LAELSSGWEGAEWFACDVALDAAADLAVGLAFGSASLDVGLGSWAASPAGDGDGVDGVV